MDWVDEADVDDENRSRRKRRNHSCYIGKLVLSPCSSWFYEVHCTAARSMVQSARPRARGAKRWSSHTNAAMVIRRTAVWPSAVPSRLHFCRHVMGGQRTQAGTAGLVRGWRPAVVQPETPHRSWAESGKAHLGLQTERGRVRCNTRPSCTKNTLLFILLRALWHRNRDVSCCGSSGTRPSKAPPEIRAANRRRWGCR
jgi:hypothetical protein